MGGRQKPTRIACKCEGAAQANDVAIDQSLQPSAPRGHDSKFRQREEPVYGDQSDDDRQFEVQHGKTKDRGANRRELRR
jgi:hypothetical protein